MLRQVTPMLIVTIFLTSLLVVPTAFITLNTAATPLDFSIPSQVGEHTVRVAIYDEDNITAPVEAGASAALSGLTNNVNEVQTLLQDAGHTVSLLTSQDILDHELTTADYDVFILINNLPRASITKLVKEFWLGGGGLLTFHKAFSFLNYESIIYPGLDADAIFIHQAVLSGVILSKVEPKEMALLPLSYNYPIHLLNGDKTNDKPRSIDQLVTFRHEGFHTDPDWEDKIPASDSLIQWLKKRVESV